MKSSPDQLALDSDSFTRGDLNALLSLGQIVLPKPFLSAKQQESELAIEIQLDFDPFNV